MCWGQGRKSVLDDLKALGQHCLKTGMILS